MKKLAKKVFTTTALATLAYQTYKHVAKKNFEKMSESTLTLDESCISKIKKATAWMQLAHVQKDIIKTLSGSTIGTQYIDNGSAICVILSSDYNVTEEYKLYVAQSFSELGYNVLLYRKDDEKSFGWYEQFDLISLIHHFHLQYPKQKIILYGQGVGAYSSLMALNDKGIDYIQAVVVDGAYLNIKDILASGFYQPKNFNFLFKQQYLTLAKKKFHFNPDDANVDYVIQNSFTPLLIIHSDQDEFISIQHALRLDKEYFGYHKLHVIKNFKHYETIFSAGYFQVIQSFLEKFTSDNNEY